jgi:hypothetical protein
MRKGGKLHINTLNFDHFKAPGIFKLRTSNRFVLKKDCKFGSIFKASVMSVQRKEVKGGSDYMLVV